MAAGEQCDVKVCTGVQWTQQHGGRDPVPDNTIPSTVFCWFHAQPVEISPTVSVSSRANKFPKPDFTTPCLLETHPGKEYLQHFSFLQETLGKGRSCLPSVLSVQQQADCTQVLSVRLERGTEGPVVFLSLDLLLHLPFPLDFWCLTNQGACLLTYTVALTLEEDSRGDTPL